MLNHLNKINNLVGKTISWLTLGMVFVTLTIVILRYGFNIGSIAVQESVTYMHAIVFMLGIAFTMKNDAHVRVDIFYQKMSNINRAKVDLLGHIFMLMPTCLFTFFSSLEYVINSWSILEESRETGGLPFVFLLKSTIPLMAILLLTEAIISSIILFKVIKVRD